VNAEILIRILEPPYVGCYGGGCYGLGLLNFQVSSFIIQPSAIRASSRRLLRALLLVEGC
jgi:hypothetical protein